MSDIINAAILTKNDPEVFRIICNISFQMRRLDSGKLFVIDDDSDPAFYKLLRVTTAPLSNVTVVKRSLTKDFSAQRNFVKELVPYGEWILYVDSDEWIDDTFVENARSLVQRYRGINAWLFARCNIFVDLDSDMLFPKGRIIPETGVSYPDFQGRLIQNVDGVFFTNPVHEVVADGPNVSKAYADMEHGFSGFLLHCRNSRKVVDYNNWLTL